MTEEDVQYFKSIVGDNGMIYNNEDDLFAFNTDWMNKFRGKSQLVLKPKTTQQVSDILKYCNDQKYVVVENTPLFWAYYCIVDINDAWEDLL